MAEYLQCQEKTHQRIVRALRNQDRNCGGMTVQPRYGGSVLPELRNNEHDHLLISLIGLKTTLKRKC